METVRFLQAHVISFFSGGGKGRWGRGAQHLNVDKYDKLINQSVTISLAKSATLKTV